MLRNRKEIDSLAKSRLLDDLSNIEDVVPLRHDHCSGEDIASKQSVPNLNGIRWGLKLVLSGLEAALPKCVVQSQKSGSTPDDPFVLQGLSYVANAPARPQQ